MLVLFPTASITSFDGAGRKAPEIDPPVRVSRIEVDPVSHRGPVGRALTFIIFKIWRFLCSEYITKKRNRCLFNAGYLVLKSNQLRDMFDTSSTSQREAV